MRRLLTTLVALGVATITALRPDESQAFLVGELAPAAQLDRGRDVLLLRSGAAAQIPAAAPEQEPAPGPEPAGDVP